MQLTNYKITFTGEIQSGFELEKVKQDITELFKLDEEQLSNFFSGAKVTVKKNITQEQALKYADILKSLGLIVYLEETVIMMVDVLDNEREDLKNATSSAITTQVHKRVSQPNKKSNYHANEVMQSPAIFNFDFSGRCGRLNYFNADLLLFLILCASVLLCFIPKIGPFVAMLSVVLFIIFAVRITILRLHDLNLTAWHSLLVLVPVVNFIFHLFLLFFAGSAGTNKYGNPVKQGSNVGLIVSFIGIPILWMLAVIIIPPYQDYTYRTRVQPVYQALLGFSHAVDEALREGKTPILGSETSEHNKYVPMGMAHGNVSVSDSGFPTLEGIMYIGLKLPSKGTKAKIYVIFDHKFPDIAELKISLERQKEGVWTCTFYNNGLLSTGWKELYLPERCDMVRQALF